MIAIRDDVQVETIAGLISSHAVSARAGSVFVRRRDRSQMPLVT